MVKTTRTNNGALPWLVVLAVSALTGCSSIHNKSADLAGPPTEPHSEVVVKLIDGDGDIDHLRAPLTKTMVIQDALKGSGAIRQFPRMDVVLVRTVPGGQQLRLPVKYDYSKRSVEESHNYAVHGGDVIEVTEDTSTMIDRMLAQIVQPFRPFLR